MIAPILGDISIADKPSEATSPRKVADTGRTWAEALATVRFKAPRGRHLQIEFGSRKNAVGSARDTGVTMAANAPCPVSGLLMKAWAKRLSAPSGSPTGTRRSAA